MQQMTAHDSTFSELTALKAVDTVEGQSALALAEAIDSGRSLMAAPAMVKELRATMQALRDRTPKAEDSVDEFAERRRARRAAAGL
jgi:hypothetical protein